LVGGQKLVHQQVERKKKETEECQAPEKRNLSNNVSVYCKGEKSRKKGIGSKDAI